MKKKNIEVLIGDIGNTNTKICFIDYKTYKILKIITASSKKFLTTNFFKKIIKSKKMHKIALFSSVVPAHKSKLEKILKKDYKIKLVEIKDKKIKKIVQLNIDNKNQVGSDRIANAVGVFVKYKLNCIVLDFGTATTFDVVTKNGIYNGGVIAPGVNLSLKSLIKSAHLLPPFSLKKQKKIIGKNTLEALRSGFYWGYSGLINNIILKIEQETKKKYKVIFTGGYANLFKSSIIRSFNIDRNITINGVIEIFKHNKESLL